MATTYTTLPLDGTTREFTIPFEYLTRRFVTATLIGATRKSLVLNVDFRFVTPTKISTTVAWGPADGYDTIELRRVTSAAERLVDFNDGSILRASDLNISQVQAIHIAEEGRDISDQSMLNNLLTWDALNLRIRNLADPTGFKDATNKQYVDNGDSTVASNANQRIDAAIAHTDSTVASAVSKAENELSQAVAQSNDAVLAAISKADGQLLTTLRTPTGETLSPLPATIGRASKMLAFDVSGNPIAVVTTTGSGQDLAVQLADPTKGSGLVAHKGSNAYAQETVGYALGTLSGKTKQLVGAGDSIMAGTTSPNTVSIPQALQQYMQGLKESVLSNTSVPGSRLDSSIGGAVSSNDMVARYAANVYPKRPTATGASTSILLLSIGANDFSVLSDTNVPVWCARLDSYCAQARLDGFTVVMMTIMKRTNANDNTVVNNRKRLIMNDFIRRSKNIDAYVDADQLIPDTGDTGLVIDGTHPNDTGNRLLARAFASSIATVGVPVPGAVLPITSLEPSVGSAERSILYKTSLTAVANGLNVLSTKNPPAIGTGDFTLSWWCNIPLANISANNNVFSDWLTPEHSFGVVGGSNGLARMYVLPGAGAVWSTTAIFPDVWNHCAIVRSGTQVTYYLNGVPLNTVTYADSVPSLKNFLKGANGLFTRLRAYSRAYSASEIKTQYDRLSEFDNDSACIYALEDGTKCGDRYATDISSSKADIQLIDTARLRITQSARRGTVRWTTVGSALPVPYGAPIGSRISSWSVNVTTVGTGAVDLSDTNATGKFFNGALPPGLSDLTLLSRFPTATNKLYCNATGYTIEHTIMWEYI